MESSQPASSSPTCSSSSAFTPPVWRFAPILPTSSMPRAAEEYRQLGLNVRLYQDDSNSGYAFVSTGHEAELHLSTAQQHDPLTTAASCYLYVDDADEVAAAWAAALQASGVDSASGGPGRRVLRPKDTPYGLREGAYIDGDNNLIRFGSSKRSEGRPVTTDHSPAHAGQHQH